MEVRSLVTFRSRKFNTSQSKPYFINPGCFGDDLAQWLVQQLRTLGVSADEQIHQEDFGWFLGFEAGLNRYHFVLGYNADGYWFGRLERQRGLIASAFGLRGKGIGIDAAESVHSALVSSQDIFNVRWHFRKDFNASNENLGTSTPLG